MPSDPDPIGPSGSPDPVDGGSSISGAGYYKTQILDRIFALLVKMIGSLQKVAATQADRLNFLTEWQTAYTDSMNQIHVFSRGNGDAIDDAEDTLTGNFRDDLNRVNSTYTEQLRSNRSLISDDAKALQSNVNQTNDAVTQQTNMATAIVQQFSTILGAIYR